MNRRLNELHLQRGRLLERIANQRSSLGRDIEPVRSVLDSTDRLLDQVSAIINCVKRHPVVSSLAVATLVLLKAGRVWRWTKRGFFLWKTWRKLRERLVLSGLRVPF